MVRSREWIDTKHSEPIESDGSLYADSPRSRAAPELSPITKQNSRSNLDVLSGWSDGSHDRDGTFVKEFQTTFDSLIQASGNYIFSRFSSNSAIRHYGGLLSHFPELSHYHARGDNIEATVVLHAQAAPPEYSASPRPRARSHSSSKKIIVLAGKC